MQQRVLTDKAEEALSLNDFSTVRTHSIPPRVSWLLTNRVPQVSASLEQLEVEVRELEAALASSRQWMQEVRERARKAKEAKHLQNEIRKVLV